MRIAISQSNYIPWKGYFDLIASVDLFVLFDEVQFTKRDWRNRNLIKGPKGPIWLTVPILTRGRYTQKISEVELAATNWREKHWSSLRANYTRAPHFRSVAPAFEAAYNTGTESRLSELNAAFITLIFDKLGIETPIRQSSEFPLATERSQRLLNICLDAGAKTYVSGPAAKAYLDQQLFETHGVSVEWFDYSGYEEYPQLWGSFDHHVSTLDLLFNCGQDAPSKMKCVRK